MLKNILLAANFLLLFALGVYTIFFLDHQEKKGYVLNQRIFDEFNGKKELEQQLVQLRNTHKVTLDSVAFLVDRQPANKQLVEHYRELTKNFQLEQHELSERYTADIWKRINQYVSEYGKRNDYDFIFGATGEGNLMYAKDGNNITEDVIQYLNKRYEEGN